MAPESVSLWCYGEPGYQVQGMCAPIAYQMLNGCHASRREGGTGSLFLRLGQQRARKPSRQSLTAPMSTQPPWCVGTAEAKHILLSNGMSIAVAGCSSKRTLDAILLMLLMICTDFKSQVWVLIL